MNEKDIEFITQCPYLARSKIYALEHSGVRFLDSKNVYIGEDVEIGAGTLVWPGVFILGSTVIGKNCEIEHDVHLENVRVGDNTIIHKGCYINESEIGKGCELWVDQSMHRAVIEDNIRSHKGNRIVWSRIKKGSVLEQGCQIKYADIGEDCRICNSIIEGDKFDEETLSSGKRSVNIGHSCAIGPWVYIHGAVVVKPRTTLVAKKISKRPKAR